MGRFIIPSALIIISIGLLFFFVNPAYSRIDVVRQSSSAYSSALSKSRELQELRDSLLAEYNTFSASNIERLKKMLPDHVDNVRLIIEIDGIASQYGMTIRDVALASEADSKDKDDRSIFEAISSNRKEMSLGFTVVAPYESFLKFLRDVEKNLRIVDIESVKFSSSDADLYEYTIILKTYWLAPDN